MVTKASIAEVRSRYVNAAILGDASLARSVIQQATDGGVTPCEIYLSVLAPAQVKLGDLWHAGKINIAQEHLATSITMQLMDLQRQAMKPRNPIGLRAVVTPVEGDMHFIGARMFADLLIMDGWDVDFFWNPAPADDLVEYVQQRRVHLLALASTVPEQLPNVVSVCDQLRSVEPPRPKTLLGGAALNTTGVDIHSLGVDAIANDLGEAVKQARELVGYRERPPTLEEQLIFIGRNVRAARTQSKLTQKQLAEAADLDRTYISLVEHGKQNPTIAALLRIADAVQTPISDLLSHS